MTALHTSGSPESSAAAPSTDPQTGVMRDLRITQAPYPGLRPFAREESDIFFGREVLVDELLRRLDRSRFLGLVGVSGCGKSSLLRAGLIPALETGFLARAGVHWRVLEMRPGNRPMRRLAQALRRSWPAATRTKRWTRRRSSRRRSGAAPWGCPRSCASTSSGRPPTFCSSSTSSKRSSAISRRRRQRGRRVRRAGARGGATERIPGLRGARHALRLSRRVCTLPRLAGGAQRQPVSHPTPDARAAARGDRRSRRRVRCRHRASAGESALERHGSGAGPASGHAAPVDADVEPRGAAPRRPRRTDGRGLSAGRWVRRGPVAARRRGISAVWPRARPDTPPRSCFAVRPSGSRTERTAGDR